MKVRFNRWYNAVLTTLLSMLGYGCSSEEPMDMYGTVVEYGAPNVDYVIRGTVTDETDTPILGIKTVLKEIPDNYPNYTYSIDSAMTDATGKYQIETRIFLGQEGQKLIVEDIDGEANGGEFLSDTIDISKIEAKKIGEGDGKWNSGKYEIKADVKMKKK
ncbi:MAG: radical SAM-associated putative lipoprotein [Prevotella sp.]|nr:radical SAM-associated putative lipoprotein [Prevotella sp.]